MPYSAGLLKNNFQSQKHACSSHHAHNFCMSKLSLSTQNLSSQNRYNPLFSKENCLDIFFYVSYAETTQSNKRYQFENFIKYIYEFVNDGHHL